MLSVLITHWSVFAAGVLCGVGLAGLGTLVYLEPRRRKPDPWRLLDAYARPRSEWLDARANRLVGRP